MAKIIHGYGKGLTVSDKVNNPYLDNKLWSHTSCGYLFDDTEENRERMSHDKDKITCKACLRTEGILLSK
jgi:hypothetical protein